MEVELRPGREFEDALAKLRVGPANIRRKLNKSVKDATAPVEKALKDAVMGIESQGKRGGGRSQRAAHLSSRSKSGKLPKHTGLRVNTARGITRKITYSGTSAGVRIRADTKYLPESQKVMPRAMNDGKVRHPIFNDRSVWVDQTFTPAGWFDRTVAGRSAELVEKINAAAREAMRELQ